MGHEHASNHADDKRVQGQPHGAVSIAEPEPDISESQQRRPDYDGRE